MKHKLLVILVIGFMGACAPQTEQNKAIHSDPLPSWNEGGSKQSILRFVEETTTPQHASFIPQNERIVVFDNDGTLWSEQPVYFQFMFAMDRVKALAAENPEWYTKQPFKALLEGDIAEALSGGEKAIIEIVMATHAGMSTNEFEKIVTDWIRTARHPETNKLFKEMVYQPMLELLDYFRDNGFKTYIVSGGGIDFMRPWVEEVYGIPPDQVVGSSGKVEFVIMDGQPTLIKQPEIDFIDDKEGKPVGIYKHIGKQPVAAFGNSDGDLAMLQWTAAGEGSRLMVYIHHTDAEREWAYDRDSHVGKLDKGLDEAQDMGWVVVDMKSDWKSIYPK